MPGQSPGRFLVVPLLLVALVGLAAFAGAGSAPAPAVGLALSPVATPAEECGPPTPSDPFSASPDGEDLPTDEPAPGSPTASPAAATPVASPAASPPPSPEGVTRGIGGITAVAGFPDTLLGLNRFELAPGASIEVACYPAALLVYVERGAPTLLVAGGAVGVTPATPGALDALPGAACAEGRCAFEGAAGPIPLAAGDLVDLSFSTHGFENPGPEPAVLIVASVRSLELGCGPRPCSIYPSP